VNLLVSDNFVLRSERSRPIKPLQIIEEGKIDGGHPHRGAEKRFRNRPEKESVGIGAVEPVMVVIIPVSHRQLQEKSSIDKFVPEPAPRQYGAFGTAGISRLAE
jgi:hypothetical protein